MPYEELTALLWRARGLLERYMFEPDGATMRDDVAQICMAIDDALPDERPASPSKVEERERSAA
jgi:hypothetical protein